MQQQYTDLFIDFDDTLYDTHGNAELSLVEVWEHYNLKEYFTKLEDFTVPYWNTNIELWELYAHGKIERDYLMVERFRRPLALGLSKEGKRFDTSRENCLHVSDYFLDCNAVKPGTVEGAHELMDYLRSRGYKLHMCSNGFREVQFRKLKASQLLEYFDTVILSEDAGVNKPSPDFFRYAFRQTGAQPSTTMMIGDNPTTDIEGAKAAGLSTIFYNRWPEYPSPDAADYSVSKLLEIKEIL